MNEWTQTRHQERLKKKRTGRRKWEGRGKGIFLMNWTENRMGVCPARRRGLVGKTSRNFTYQTWIFSTVWSFSQLIYDVWAQRTWVLFSYSNTHFDNWHWESHSTGLYRAAPPLQESLLALSFASGTYLSFASKEQWFHCTTASTTII